MPERTRFPALLATLALLALTALCGCGDADSAQSADAGSGRLVVTGSSTVAPLVADLARDFELQREGVRIDVQTGGSSRGISDVRQGLAHVGMVSRALTTAEDDLDGHQLARDGVALIVHADNPIADLSREDVIRVYTGQARDWGSFGLDPAPITVVHKADGRSTQEVFLHHFELDPADVSASVVIGDNEQGVKTVAGNPDAIGYVSVGTARYNAGEGVPIRVLERPRGADAIARPLNLVTRSEPAPLARRLVEYSQSEAVHDLIRGLYFEPLAPRAALGPR